MAPSNIHELIIARLVNHIHIDGKLGHCAVADVRAEMDFALSQADSEFLVRYIHWRMANPIVK